MENQTALNYEKVISYVDVILVIRSSYFVAYLGYLWLFEYNWICQPINLSDSWLSKLEIKLAHEFIVTEFLYLLQNVVCVACKKDDSVSLYLLLHHTMFPLLLWVGGNYYPGGHAGFLVFMNAIEHSTTMSARFIYVTFELKSLRKIVRLFYQVMQVS